MESPDLKPQGGLSWSWDVLLPLALFALPGLCFGAMRLLISLEEGQGAEQVSESLLNLAVGLQTLGIVAMAVIALVRYERGKFQVAQIFPQQVPNWRLLGLRGGIVCLTAADVVVNVAAVFPGAEFLLTGAVPLYVIYLLALHFALSLPWFDLDEELE